MGAPLIPNPTATKSDGSYVGPNAAAFALGVKRAHAQEVALSAFRRQRGDVRKADAQPATRSSSGIGQLLSGAMPDHAPVPVEARKIDDANLHPRVKAIAANLPTDAGRLLDLVVKAHDYYRGAQLVDVSSSDAAKALGISKAEAESARALLEMRGLLNFFDDHSGNRGFRPSTSF